MSLKIQNWTNPAYGHEKSNHKTIILTLRARRTWLGNRKHDASFYLTEFWIGLQIFDLHD